MAPGAGGLLPSAGIRAKADACVARGGVSPSVRDRLLALLAGNGAGAGVMNLSANGVDNGVAHGAALGDGDAGPDSRVGPSRAWGDALAMEVFDILADNRAAALGEKTGVQALSRVAPDETDRGAPLYAKMAAMAEGKPVEL